MRKLFITLAILPIMGIWWLSTITPTLAQTPTVEGCIDIDLPNGKPVFGNDSNINFYGVYFQPQNDILVTDIAMSLFRQGGTTQTPRFTIHEVAALPSSLGPNQPVFVSENPLWASGEIAAVNFGVYSGFTDAQRGNPANWHTVDVSPDLQLTAGTTYALGMWSVTTNATFGTMLVLAASETSGGSNPGPCGISNTYITAGGQVYTQAELIPSASINSTYFGCDLSSFVFPCSTDLGLENLGYIIYGTEVFNPDVGGIEGWWPNFLEGLGQNTPFGAFMISVLIAMVVTAMMLALKVPWVFALGVPAILTVAFTLAQAIDPGIFLAGVAILLAAGILAIVGLRVRD